MLCGQPLPLEAQASRSVFLVALASDCADAAEHLWMPQMMRSKLSGCSSARRLSSYTSCMSASQASF